MKLTYIKITLILLLAAVLGSCQTATVSKAPVEKPVVVPGVVDEATLSPQEEAFLRAFQLETEESWMPAARAYQNLAESSVQPDRSANFINSALMNYRAGRYHIIEPFFEALKQDDILPADENYKSIILAGAYFGIGKIYQSLLALPDIDDISDYRFKALALNIRSKGVLAIGKPLESVRLRIQIDEYLKTVKEIEKNHDFIWDALNRISEPAILRTLGVPICCQKRSSPGYPSGIKSTMDTRQAPILR